MSKPPTPVRDEHARLKAINPFAAARFLAANTRAYMAEGEALAREPAPAPPPLPPARGPVEARLREFEQSDPDMAARFRIVHHDRLAAEKRQALDTKRGELEAQGLAAHLPPAERRAALDKALQAFGYGDPLGGDDPGPRAA